MQNKDFFPKLRQLRIAHNFTYKGMSERLKISTNHYWQIENKKRGLYYKMAQDIAAIFNLKPDDIFYDEY